MYVTYGLFFRCFEDLVFCAKDDGVIEIGSLSLSLALPLYPLSLYLLFKIFLS